MREKLYPFKVIAPAVALGVILIPALVVVGVLSGNLDLAAFLISYLVTTLLLVANRLTRARNIRRRKQH